MLPNLFPKNRYPLGSHIYARCRLSCTGHPADTTIHPRRSIMYRLFIAGLDSAVASVLIIPAVLILNRICFHSWKKTFFYTILSVYLAGVYLVVGLPNVTYVRLEANINQIPFLDLFSNLSATLLNIVLFLPLGLLSVILWKPFQKVKYNLTLGFFITLSIEILQLFTFRATDVNDLITNTFGCLIGWFLGSKLAKRWPGVCCNGTRNETILVFSTVLGIMFFIHPFLAPMIWNLIY